MKLPLLIAIAGFVWYGVAEVLETNYKVGAASMLLAIVNGLLLS